MTANEAGKYIGVTITARKANYTDKTATDITDATNNTIAKTAKVATIPTAANYCQTGLVYTGSSQTIVKTAGTGYTWTAGTTRTDAGSQNESSRP